MKFLEFEDVENMSDKRGVIFANALIDALDSVTWYNGIAEDVLKWKKLPKDSHGILCPGGFYDAPGLEVIWMICVCLFGDYGTSPRSGWIENVDSFYEFIDDITKTQREDWGYYDD